MDTDNQSDDDPSASAAEPGYSPDKGEGRTKVDTTDSEKPWLSPCRDVHKRIQSPGLKSLNKKDSDTPIQVKGTSAKDSDFSEEGDQVGVRQKKSRQSSVRKKCAEKRTPVCSSENPQTPEGSEMSKIVQKEKSPDKSKKGKLKAAKTCTQTRTHSLSDTLDSPSYPPSPVAASGDVSVKPSKESSFQKAPKRARQSLSSLVRPFTAPSRTKNATSTSADGDDDTFEDFFSPANLKQGSQTPVLATRPVGRAPSFELPFDLGSETNKKKTQRRSESISSEANSRKKRKLEEGQSGKQTSKTQSPQLDVKESLPPSDASTAEVKPVEKKQRRRTLPVTRTERASSAEVKKKRASKLEQAATVTEANAESEQQENSADSVFTDVKSE